MSEVITPSEVDRYFHHYSTILADPPWPERGGGKIKRGADRHYPLMSIDALAGMSAFVRRITNPDCHLYLWATNNYLNDAILRILPAWDFRYVTLITWYKTGGPGLGQYFRGVTEHVVFGVRGSPPYRQGPDGKRAQGRTGFKAPRARHSEKPDKIREWAELVSHPPRIELFARSLYPGWDAWGNEAATDGSIVSYAP